MGVRLVAHRSGHASDVLLIDKVEEVLSAFMPSCHIPHKRQYERQQCETSVRQRSAPEASATYQREHPHHKAGQNEAHRTLGQNGSTHAKHRQQRKSLAATLPPTIEQKHCAHHASRQYHVHTAVYTGSVHLEGGQQKQGSHQRLLSVTTTLIEDEAAYGHADESQSRRQTRRIFVHAARQ